MRFYPIGGGGGADLDVVTAGAEHVLAPKVIVDKDGNPITGAMIDRTGTALTVATNGQTLIPQGYHDGTQYAKNTQATMTGGTKTPSTSQVTVSCNGKLMTSNIVIPAFSLPSASVIKKGTTVTIYGKSVTGTWEGYVDDIIYLFNNGDVNVNSGGWSFNTSYVSISSGKIVSSSTGNYKCMINNSRNWYSLGYRYLYVVGVARSESSGNVYGIIGANTDSTSSISDSIAAVSSLHTYKLSLNSAANATNRIGVFYPFRNRETYISKVYLGKT